MKFVHLLALGFFVGNISCTLFRSGHRHAKTFVRQEVMVAGHRGEAGHFPENSIEGFLSAVRKGVDALEMDVVISADKKVVVSHEPYMASHYVLDPKGEPISKQSEYNIYEMEYQSIRKFDAGLKYNKDFPKQKKISSYKPLLEEVIDSIENVISKEGLKSIEYMIEIKSDPQNYNYSQPEPTEFIDLVMNVILQKGIEERSIIKSFDPNILNRLHEKHPQIQTSFLVSKKGIKKNLSQLNFLPDYYSPRHKLVANKEYVDSVKSRGMKLVPWTVNRKRKIQKLLSLGVDGIITDYPERVIKQLEKIKK